MGHEFQRDEEGYEDARRATCWNARTPDRYPDLVVQAVTDADVVAAVRAARDQGMKIGVRSGAGGARGSSCVVG